MGLTVTMLGCGTSTGVPVIGCDCAVCTSIHPRNQRLRCALRLEMNGCVYVVDTPPDFRQQALRFGIERLDGLLFTHAHADHIYGLDDVRIFNFRQARPIPCYGSEPTLDAIRRSFTYIFDQIPDEGGGKPKLELIPVGGPFHLDGREVVPVPVLHGSMEVYGYRIGRFAYLTDCNRIPAASRALLEGVEVLILDALRYRSHSTHFTVAEAVEVAVDLGARRTILTHLAHEIDYTAPRLELPPGMELGYDGLSLELD